MDNDRIYVGSGKEKFEGNLINTTINLSKIMKTSKDYIFEYNGEQYIKLKVAKKKETDEYGKSHYVEVDTWKPEKLQSKPTENNNMDATSGKSQKELLIDEDLPF